MTDLPPCRLSIPVQLIIIALAVGTGVGTNTLMAKQYALKDEKGANHTAGVGTVLAVIMWALISVISIAFMGPYVAISAQSPVAMQYANEYGMIVSIGSIGLFLRKLDKGSSIGRQYEAADDCSDCRSGNEYRS